jgi:mono/diheme cytochrome c family protein
MINTWGMAMVSIWVAPMFALAMIGIANTAYAQGPEIGKYEYFNSCASCHGPAGKGDGPVATALKRTPADLTKLSEANKGVFPFARTYEVIDGRFEVETHGKRDMPVWGEVYKPTWGSAQSAIPPFVSRELAESIVRGRILALIEYISTLQGR